MMAEVHHVIAQVPEWIHPGGHIELEGPVGAETSIFRMTKGEQVRAISGHLGGTDPIMDRSREGRNINFRYGSPSRWYRPGYRR